MKVLVLVTHLHGTGHLARALAISESLTKHGHQVMLLSGGVPVALFPVHDEISFVQLPSVKSNGVDFSMLLDEGGEQASSALLAERKRLILASFYDFQPDCVLTELFPFGRRSLKDEFLSLLSIAKNADPVPLIVTSVRDILEPPSTREKRETVEKLLAEFYDGILVHGAQDFIPFETSWGDCAAFKKKLLYTGYVYNVRTAPASSDQDGKGEVIVTAGGGPLGHQLFDVALECCKAGVAGDRSWRFLIGGGDADQVIEHLRRQAGQQSNIIIERARSDFPALLQRAALSIQRTGYNTVLDLLNAGKPAVLCPYDLGHEKEQTIRAHALGERFNFPVVSGCDLDLNRLAAACENSLSMIVRSNDLVAMGGVEKSVNYLEKIFTLSR